MMPGKGTGMLQLVGRQSGVLAQGRSSYLGCLRLLWVMHPGMTHNRPKAEWSRLDGPAQAGKWPARLVGYLVRALPSRLGARQLA